MLKIDAGATIHNRFDIEVEDIMTGDRRCYQAENIVLDQIWARLVNFQTYFNNIHWGTGTGVFTSARTSLFTHRGTRTATTHELVRQMGVSRMVRRIILNPEEEVGITFREVGIAFGSGATELVTHAGITDLEGFPLTFTKTATQVVTIFATVFVSLDPIASSFGPNVAWVGLPNRNPLLTYLLTGTGMSVGMFGLGSASGARLVTMNNLTKSATALGTISAGAWSVDLANRRVTSGVGSFGTGAGNGHVAEVGFGVDANSPIWSMTFPNSAYDGHFINGRPIGTGNGTQTIFELPSHNARDDVAIHVNGVPSSVTIHRLPAFQITSGIWGTGDSPGGCARVQNGSTFRFVVCGSNTHSTRMFECPPTGLITELGHPLAQVRSQGSPSFLQVGTTQYFCYITGENATAVARCHLYDWATNGFTEIASIAAVYALLLRHGNQIFLIYQSHNDLHAYNIAELVGNQFTYRWRVDSHNPRGFNPFFDGTNGYYLESATSSWRVMRMAANGTATAISTAIANGGVWFDNAGRLELFEFNAGVIVRRRFLSAGTLTALPVPSHAIGTASAVYHLNGLVHVSGPNGTVRFDSDSTFTFLDLTLVAAGGGTPLGDTPQIQTNGNLVLYRAGAPTTIIAVELVYPRVVAELPVAPAVGQTITAVYTVNGIHKDVNHIMNFQCSLQFGTPT